MKRMPIAVAALLGLLTAFACIPLIGISSAVPAPREYFEWARLHGLLEPAVFVWNIVVVGGIGVGAPALVSLAVLVRTFAERHVAIVTVFVAALLFGLYVAVPVAYFDPLQLPVNLPWWSFGKEVALVLVAAGVLASVRRHA
jgi:hypothetical protein